MILPTLASKNPHDAVSRRSSRCVDALNASILKILTGLVDTLVVSTLILEASYGVSRSAAFIDASPHGAAAPQISRDVDSFRDARI